jgi:hypothetical protein
VQEIEMAKAQTYRVWMDRRVEALRVELNQDKKRGSEGWQTKKQCWQIAQREWVEKRHQALARMPPRASDGRFAHRP